MSVAESLPGGFVVVPEDEHLSMIGPFVDPPAAFAYGRDHGIDGFQVRFIEAPEWS
jgi:hypothetical protein